MPRGSNNVFTNYSKDPAIGYNFLLRVEGIYDVPCRKISPIRKDNEYEIIKEGGVNDYVHLKRKQIQQPFTFEVERYVGLDYLDPLPNGAEMILPIILFVGSGYGNILTNTRRTYIFTGCVVMGKEYGELNAEHSGLLIEKTKIAYETMYTLDGIMGDMSLLSSIF